MDRRTNNKNNWQQNQRSSKRKAPNHHQKISQYSNQYDANSSFVWQDHWQRQGQSWRTEPEIDALRQRYLFKCLTTVPDIKQGKFPFKDICLTRADVEWLISEYEKEYGLLVWDEEHRSEHKGLDLRGANLCEVDLHGLPLTYLRGGLALDERYVTNDKDPNQRNIAAIHLEGANLRNTHLEGANLNGAYLEGANLNDAFLERADLSQSHLEKATLCGANLRKARLREAYLQNTDLRKAHLEQALLADAHLEKANLCGTFLEKADLRRVYLLQADCINIYLGQANLYKAHLEGAMLPIAHLEGANLSEAHLEGANLISASFCLADIKVEEAPDALPITSEQAGNFSFTNLSSAFFDTATNLENIVFEGDGTYVLFADIRWGGVNLAVVDWNQVSMLGEEYNARQKKTASGQFKDKSTRHREFLKAIRANRQLAIVLQGQGLNEEASYFSYRAQVLRRKLTWHQLFHGRLVQKTAGSISNSQGISFQRQLLWLRQKIQDIGFYLFSMFLDLLAGYGYKPGRSLLWYLLVLFGFAATYTVFNHFPPIDAFFFSLTSFHGRGFFPSGSVNQHLLNDPAALLAAIEAVIGLFIEISFVAAFTQRFLGK